MGGGAPFLRGAVSEPNPIEKQRCLPRAASFASFLCRHKERESGLGAKRPHKIINEQTAGSMGNSKTTITPQVARFVIVIKAINKSNFNMFYINSLKTIINLQISKIHGTLY